MFSDNDLLREWSFIKSLKAHFQLLISANLWGVTESKRTFLKDSGGGELPSSPLSSSLSSSSSLVTATLTVPLALTVLYCWGVRSVSES